MFRHGLTQLNRVLSKLSRTWIVSLALLCVVLIGVPDYLTGIEISLSVFYLCPVGIATWYAGMRLGSLLAIISTVVYLAGNFSAGHLYSQPGYLLWNGMLHLGFMLIVAYLLDNLRAYLDIEQRLARTDVVTGIFNRLAFLERLHYNLDLATREQQPISIAYFDLDDFKRINDTQGHAAGDRVLQLVAQTLADSIRRTDTVGRLGGDEFALLMPGLNQQAAETVIAKVRAALQQTFATETTQVTCSIGCISYLQPPPNVDTALTAADLLMYKIKHQGKNAVAFKNGTAVLH